MINKQEINDFRSEVASMSGNLPPANIIIAGVTGCGKSTLINAIFGKQLAKTGCGSAVTHEMAKYYEEGLPVCVWDTVGLELDAETTQKTIFDIKELIRKKSENKENKFDRIHSIWYCIQAVGARIQNLEIEFIAKMYRLGVPFTIVLTKCINKKKDIEFLEEVKKCLSNKGVTNIPIIPVLAEDWEVNEGIVIHRKGLQELIDETAQNLKSSIFSSFIAAQRIDKEMKRNEAEEIIIQYCNEAKKSFIAHIPIVNIFSTSSSIKNMFKDIGVMYNTQLSKAEIEKIHDLSIGEWKGKAVTLLNPLPMNNKAEEFFENKVKGKVGFENKALEFKYFDRAAQLITWSGYSWIFAIEKFWDELIEADATARDKIVDNMINALRDYMKTKNIQNE